MSHLEEAERIAERLCHEPYNPLTNNCFFKSAKLKRECAALGIPIKIVACICLAKAHLFGFWMTIPVIHGWAVVEGKKIETS